MAKIGAHKSISGGYDKAVERVAEIGGNCLQIFSSSPRGWTFKHKITDEDVERFIRKRKGLGVDPVYFHASYLINLADGEGIGEKSVKTLTAELNLALKVAVRGSVIHLGSFKDKKEKPAFENKNYGVLLDNIKKVLKNTPEEKLFIIENAGNRKVGRFIEEVERIIKDVGDNRLRFCFDTCHLHAAGYNISDERKLDDFLKGIDRTIGLEKLELIHINDSKDKLGDLRDRHENIGEGYVGETVFKQLFTDKRTKDLPFVTEAPGFDGKGPDKKNIDILKKIAGGN